MDPHEYLQQYIKVILSPKTILNNDRALEDLILPEYCYRNQYPLENYIEIMNRSELLQFIKTLYNGEEESDEPLTTRKFSARMVDLKNRLEQQTDEATQLVAEFAIQVDPHLSDIAKQRFIVESLIEKIKESNRAKIELDTKISELNSAMLELYDSTSWRITAPLRFLSRHTAKMK